MTEPADPIELAEAARLDDEITEALAGRPSTSAEPTTLWLSSALRATPSQAVHDKIAALVRPTRQGRPSRRPSQRPGRQPSRRPWRFVEVAAAVLALLLATQGIGNLVAGEWVAAHLHQPFSEHAAFEGGIALLGLGLAIGSGALRRRLLPVSIGAGVPVGVVFAIHGTEEFGVFALGAALHMAQGVAAIVLLLTWLLARRYGRWVEREDRA